MRHTEFLPLEIFFALVLGLMIGLGIGAFISISIEHSCVCKPDKLASYSDGDAICQTPDGGLYRKHEL